MQEINLLKKEAQSSEGFSFNFRQTGQWSVYVVFGLVFLELLFFGFLVLSKQQVKKRTLQLEQRASDIVLEISQIDGERQKAIAVQSRLQNLDVLLASHLLWSKVFAELESKTYQPISFDSLQVDQTNNRFVLSGLAPTQTDIAKFMLGLETSLYIQNVNLRTAAAQRTEEPGFSFNMEITFDPKLLRQ